MSKIVSKSHSFPKNNPNFNLGLLIFWYLQLSIMHESGFLLPIEILEIEELVSTLIYRHTYVHVQNFVLTYMCNIHGHMQKSISVIKEHKTEQVCFLLLGGPNILSSLILPALIMYSLAFCSNEGLWFPEWRADSKVCAAS